MNIKRIKDAGYKSQYSVAVNVNGKNLSIREEGGQTKIFRSLADGGDIYLYARQNSDGTFDLEYIDHSKYMQSRSTADNVEESLGTYTLVDVLNTMANFKGPVDDYFFARMGDSRRIKDDEDEWWKGGYKDYVVYYGDGNIEGEYDTEEEAIEAAEWQLDMLRQNGSDEEVFVNNIDTCVWSSDWL